jgi:hypothetical protein
VYKKESYTEEENELINSLKDEVKKIISVNFTPFELISFLFS